MGNGQKYNAFFLMWRVAFYGELILGWPVNEQINFDKTSEVRCVDHFELIQTEQFNNITKVIVDLNAASVASTTVL